MLINIGVAETSVLTITEFCEQNAPVAKPVQLDRHGRRDGGRRHDPGWSQTDIRKFMVCHQTASNLRFSQRRAKTEEPAIGEFRSDVVRIPSRMSLSQAELGTLTAKYLKMSSLLGSMRCTLDLSALRSRPGHAHERHHPVHCGLRKLSSFEIVFSSDAPNAAIRCSGAYPSNLRVAGAWQ